MWKKKRERSWEKKKMDDKFRIKEKIDWHGTAPRHIRFFLFYKYKKMPFHKKKK